MTKRGEVQRYFDDVVMAYEGNACFHWPYATSRGYAVMAARNRNGKKQCEVGVLICERIHGSKPTPKHEQRHTCGNGSSACVTKRHVEWSTHKDNIADRTTHGTENIGEKNGGGRKLTLAKAREIYHSSEPHKAIVSKHGVSYAMVWRIKKGIAWKHAR